MIDFDFETFSQNNTVHLFDTWFENLEINISSKNESALIAPFIDMNYYQTSLGSVPGSNDSYVKLGIAFRLLKERQSLLSDMPFLLEELNSFEETIKSADMFRNLNDSIDNVKKIIRIYNLQILNGVLGIPFNRWANKLQYEDGEFDSIYSYSVFDKYNQIFTLNHELAVYLFIKLSNKYVFTMTTQPFMDSDLLQQKGIKLLLKYVTSNEYVSRVSDNISLNLHASNVNPASKKSLYSMWTRENPSYDEYIYYLNILMPAVYKNKGQNEEFDSGIQIILKDIMKIHKEEAKPLIDLINLDLFRPGPDCYSLLTAHSKCNIQTEQLPHLD